MDFDYSDKVLQYREKLQEFMDVAVVPASSSVAAGTRKMKQGGGSRGGRGGGKKSIMSGGFSQRRNKKLPSCMFSTGHSLTFKMTRNMMNICTKDNDLLGAIRHCTTLLQIYAAVCPANYPETASHHAWRVELIEALLDQTQNNSKKMPPKMLGQMNHMMQESARICLEMRHICFGKSHPLTLRARAKVLVRGDGSATLTKKT